MSVPDEESKANDAVDSGSLPGARALDRQLLLDAMAAVCSERGYAATSVDGVCRRAGLSEADFHKFFRDKEDCFLSAINVSLAEVITAATEAYSADKPLVAVVRDAARAILIALANSPTVAHIGFVDTRTATPAALEVYESGTRVLTSLLDQLRADSPTDHALPSSAARAALGGAEGLIRHEVTSGRADSLPSSLPAVLYSCLVPFLGQDEALRQAANVAA